MKNDNILESFINRGKRAFKELLKIFLESKGKILEDYYDDILEEKSTDDYIFLYSHFLKIKDYKKFIESCDLMVAERGARDDIGREVIALKPINNDKKWDGEQKRIIDFDKKYRNSVLYHVSKVKNRDSILRYGLKTKRSVIKNLEKFEVEESENSKSERFNKNFEAFDDRIYLIVYDLVQELGPNTVDILSDAIRNLVAGFVFWDKEDKDKEFDVWEVTLPENVTLHDDPSFPYGGYVKNPIPPQNISLIDTYDAKSESFDKGGMK